MSSVFIVLDVVHFVSDGLSCTEDVHFYLFFADLHELCDFLVGFPLDVALLNAGALFLRQAVNEQSNDSYSVFQEHLLVGT